MVGCTLKQFLKEKNTRKAEDKEIGVDTAKLNMKANVLYDMVNDLFMDWIFYT